MKITADTNIFLAVALEEPERKRIVKMTAGHELIAPAVLPFEIGNALSALCKREVLTVEEGLLTWQSIQAVPVELQKIDLQSALDHAIHFGIFAYDAYFLECALRCGSPLLTLDKGMKHIAQRLNIQLLEV